MTEITEKTAIEALTAFFTTEADLDALAQALSDYVRDDVVCVTKGRHRSVAFLNGSRRAAIEAQSVADLGLGIRARKCLAHMGISTIGQLLRTTDKTLRECANFSDISLREIHDVLAKRQLFLKA